MHLYCFGSVVSEMFVLGCIDERILSGTVYRSKLYETCLFVHSELRFFQFAIRSLLMMNGPRKETQVEKPEKNNGDTEYA